MCGHEIALVAKFRIAGKAASQREEADDKKFVFIGLIGATCDTVMWWCGFSIGCQAK